jgi:hypothetical protein
VDQESGDRCAVRVETQSATDRKQPQGGLCGHRIAECLINSPPPPPCSNPTPGLLLQSWLIDPPASSPLQRQAALLQAALRQATPALRQPPEATLALLLPPRSVLPPRDVAEVAPPGGSLAEVAESVSVPSVTAGQQKAPVSSGLTPGL